MLNRRVHFRRKCECITANRMLLAKVIYALRLNVGTNLHDMRSRTYRRKKKEEGEKELNGYESYTTRSMKRFSHSFVDRVEQLDPI